MKTKLNLTIDEDLVPLSKKMAKEGGHSVSELVEQLLRTALSKSSPSFATRWRGQFRPAGKSDARYKALSDRFLK